MAVGATAEDMRGVEHRRENHIEDNINIIVEVEEGNASS